MRCERGGVRLPPWQPASPMQQKRRQRPLVVVPLCRALYSGRPLPSPSPSPSPSPALPDAAQKEGTRGRRLPCCCCLDLVPAKPAVLHTHPYPTTTTGQVAVSNVLPRSPISAPTLPPRRLSMTRLCPTLHTHWPSPLLDRRGLLRSRIRYALPILLPPLRCAALSFDTASCN